MKWDPLKDHGANHVGHVNLTVQVDPLASQTLVMLQELCWRSEIVAANVEQIRNHDFFANRRDASLGIDLQIAFITRIDGIEMVQRVDANIIFLLRQLVQLEETIRILDQERLAQIQLLQRGTTVSD